MRSTLSRKEIKKFYDRFGSRQDAHAFYEDAATEDLITHAAFDQSQAVFELGCGTGRFAEHLLTHHLPNQSRYLGIDLSSTMVQLARQRLDPWEKRAQVWPTTGSLQVAAGDQSFDRFVSHYVFDLLSEEDIRLALSEARRLLTQDGSLCLVSLTHGVRPLSFLVTWFWKRIFALRPQLLGGCRPINLLDFLSPPSWHVVYENTVAVRGITSQVVLARKL